MIKFEKWNRKEKPDVFKLVRELEKEGWQTYTFESYLESYYDKHKHEGDEIRVLLEGEIRFGSGDKIFELKPGDKIFVKAGTTHWAEVIGDKKAVMLSGSK